MTFYITDVELILGVPAYGRAVDLHLTQDQLVAVVQSDLALAFTGGGINGQELVDVATSSWSKLSSSDGASCYIRYLLGSSLFIDKSSNIVPSKVWPVAWIYMYFPMFAPAIRSDAQSSKPYIQQYPMWTPYRPQEIRDCWVSTWHDFIMYFDCIEAYMPDRVVRHHSRIQNPLNIPCRFNVPVDSPMPPPAFLDLVAREARLEDVGKEEKFDRIADLLMRHYRAG
ncbi:hypothetical protein M9H77_09685 [Catharanthus roseus]|uniref:Uncharacterized protein n=1 Tax=Catharanthus roseus TaxID=4058 RepID=A0ACC0C1H5_CATRO|nr:hypothetical protein M9H77_09685 [Catharanthus roseus]